MISSHRRFQSPIWEDLELRGPRWSLGSPIWGFGRLADLCFPMGNECLENRNAEFDRCWKGEQGMRFVKETIVFL